MIIGIDLDDTICNTNEKLYEYQEKFVANENINVDTLWNNKIYKDKFLNMYLEKIYNEAELKENADVIINNLKKQGNTIYIITARTKNYVSDIYRIINNYLKKYGIVVDNVFIDGKDKVKICVDNNVDIMIDDNIYNYNMLVNGNIKTILYDEHNKNIDIIDRASSWKDINDIIINLLDKGSDLNERK